MFNLVLKRPFTSTCKKCLPAVEKDFKQPHIPVFKYIGNSNKKKSKDRVYVWGYAGTGALGEKQFIRPEKNIPPVLKVRKPWRLKWVDFTDAHVTQVACGNGFSLMVVAGDSRFKGDKVYGTGMNTQSQLGIHQVGNGDYLKFIIEPNLISLPLYAPQSVSISRVACGRAHSLVLTSEGVFTFGNNSYGQCGRNIIENEEYFGNLSIIQNISKNIEEEIKDIYCGQDHSVFLTKSGRILTCGWAADGQLGQGISTTHSKPSLVQGDLTFDIKIIKVATKGDFCLALSESGEVFGWGNNEYKQLQMSGITEPQILFSRHLKLPSYVTRPIIDIACSGTHCLVIDKNHRVWTWGFGLLGKGPKTDESVEPIEIPETLFGKYKELPDTLKRKAQAVRCGLNTSAVIMDDGTLYMWGKNNYGQLGTGDTNDVYFPLRVNIPASIRSIDCGADTTFSICKAYV
jgi:RCC1-like G exchanging factor-like protein